MNNLSRVGVFLIAGLLTGCAAPSVETSILMPAKQASMAAAKRIGITPLKGDQAGQYTAQLQAFIANIKVEGEPFFTLIDIDRSAVMREQRLSDSALFDAETAVELGRLVAADTILSGAVQTPKYTKTRSVEEREKCVAGKKAENGSGYETCEKYETYIVPCAHQSMRFGVTLRATNVATGTVGFIQDYADTAGHHYCADTGRARDKESLKAEAIGKVTQKVRMDIAPYPVRFTISFLDYDEKSGLGRKNLFFSDKANVTTAFEAGLDLAGKNQSAAACVQFRKAASLFNGSPAIFHNLGVCAELEGNFDKAIAFYEQSALVSAGAIGVTAEALERAKRNQASSAKANAQLR